VRVFTDSRCLGHQAPPGYPERPQRLAGILAHLRAAGLPVIDLDPAQAAAAGPDEPASAGGSAGGSPAGRAPSAPSAAPVASAPTAPSAPSVAFAASVASVASAPSAAPPGDPLDPPDFPELAAITALHSAAYVRRFERAASRGDAILDSADNPLSPGVWPAARAAVAATLAATDWVAAGSDRIAFAAVRPPGHHAEAATAMGFCFWNNVAIAAEHLRRRHGAARVAIFDFDVHHGNGTQHLFEARPDVFYASTHQYPFYPGTGAADEAGSGAGLGATLNVPLPAGTGDDGYAEAIGERVLPALRRFAPDVLLLSAGFDAWRADPLGGMAVTEAGFTQWGRWLRQLAAETSGGRVLAVLEGGYDLESLPRLVAAHLQGLAGG
jgi:acetoin utilization deacetylase AcuC-like enzyme